MERKLGEIFEYNGEWYQCVIATHGCNGCSFRRPNCCVSEVECFANIRADHKSVIFKKLEKIGEPYRYMDGIYQEYKAETYPIISTEYYVCITRKGFAVKIQQINKENIEEKQLNLKPFDVELAKQGKPVCTRDGRKVRIICFDANNKELPIVALLPDNKGEEIATQFTNDGKGFCKEVELMMLPEKKEGWVNIYKTNCGIKFSEQPYSTREEAIKNAAMLGRIDTIKVEWEE